MSGFYDYLPSLVAIRRRRDAELLIRPARLQFQGHAPQVISDAGGISSEEAFGTPGVVVQAPLVLPVGISLVERGDTTTEGQLITSVSFAWWAIIKKLAQDPDFIASATALLAVPLATEAVIK